MKLSDRKKSYDDLLAENARLRKTLQAFHADSDSASAALSCPCCKDVPAEAIATPLLNEQEDFSCIIESIPDIILRLDAAQRIIFVNHAVCDLSGRMTKEFLGKRICEVDNIDPSFVRSFQNSINQLFEHGQILTAEFSFDDGIKTRHYHARYMPEKTAHDTMRGALCIFHDITIYKQMLKEIARLDRLNLIGEMAAGIGHEVRNPMTTVRGFLQVLQRKTEFQPQYEFFQLMIEELDRANSIITEFLSLAKNKPVHLEEQNLVKIIQSLLPLMQADATLTDTYLEAVLELVPSILLDEKEIRQLILNLVRNGIEAMPHGGKLLLRTYLEPGHVCLSISDQGGGIPADILSNLGTPFLTTKQNGTGLGLAVCCSIVSRHNATLYPSSDANGTTFVVKFPF
ncbi:ATP-binding protein [Azotosporobacter soli]|uniref:ATP-binding protein n=1 Tax=Azotosporobacter soli TaxID=3055040 RepID=UPI0031FECC2F